MSEVSATAAAQEAPAQTAIRGLPPLSLYVHLPWCVRRCPYCDFNAHTLPAQLPETRYIDALFADLERDLPLVWGRPVVSVFFGGGTPSLFSGAGFERLISGLRSRLMLRADAEITMEANPGTTEHARFGAYREAGINRLSLGVQSFSSAQLLRLGRIHGRDEALRAYEQARSAGFDNINIDLMYALPEQDADGALEDIEQALALQPEHLSHYQLTLEPNTPFYRQPPALPDQDSAWLIQEACQQRLAAAGFHQYEVSAYAVDARRCLHNLNYWRFGDYLGIGAGAHGKITEPAEQRILRTRKPRLPEAYMSQALADGPLGKREAIASGELPFEFLLNALRLNEGVGENEFQARTGLPLSALEPALSQAREQELMMPGRLQATERGRGFLNDLLVRFMAD